MPLTIATIVAAGSCAVAAPIFSLHTALEGRSGFASEDSRWRVGGDGSLYDLAGTVRPIATAQQGMFKFHAELELTAATGDTVERSSVVGLVPAETNNDVFDFTRLWSSGRRHRDVARLDRLSMTWSPSWGSVTVGRHAVTWGGGLVFNPFDLFNPFAPGDVIRDYKVGADMIHVDVPLADGGLQLMAVGRRDPLTNEVAASASSFAMQWQRRMGSSEVTMMSAWHYDEPVLGVGISGLFGEASWRVDGTWVRVKPPGLELTDDYVAAVANIQYSWVWAGKNVLGFLEYHHNGIGGEASVASLTDPFLVTQLVRRNVFLLGSDYAAASLTMEWHPLVNSIVSLIMNLRDGSTLLQPRLAWNATQRMQITAGLDIPLGSRGTEFGGLDPGDGLGTTRAPLSAYVRATWDW